ncbi:MAG: VWA-like domain-containing protein [Myxococcota bacterium]|nr:VWA-like domain-containing protein [Myxococcota bacterium]
MAAKSEGAGLRAWLERFVLEDGFLARYPYYAHVIAALEPVADPSVPAMGVSLHDGKHYLHVNVEALMREPRFLRGILLHEVHHIVLGHLAHPKFFGVEHPDLMQIAQETSANEHIEEPLPTPVLWQHFERFGVRAGQSTIERYDKLCAARAEAQEPKLARDTDLVDEHRWREQPSAPPGGVQQTREVIESARERGEADVKRGSSKHPDNALIAGRTPDQLLAQLAGTRDAPEVYVDWRDALRTFVARARAPVHTWSRPSRRFPGRIGEIPGRAYRPRTVLRPTILVAIDTSLSMTERELTEIARQLRPMSELAQLVIVECDAAIARVYPFRGTIESVKGRGGTDLRPVFEPRFLQLRGADGVVYFTDGEGPVPERAPTLPVLWMLTKPGDFECPWGTRARLVRPGAAKSRQLR